MKKNGLEKGILIVQHFENMMFSQVSVLTLKNISGNNDSHLISTCLSRLSPSISIKSKVSLSVFTCFDETENDPQL